jgi:SAM-dependent methyltransferase
LIADDGIARLAEHRRIWERKPVLEPIYSVWFEALRRTLPERGRVLEVGAGPGYLATHLRRTMPHARVVAMDLLATSWNDVVGDGMRLPFRDATIDGVVAVDFIHHLAYPGQFFAEAARVLKPGATLACVEPWITPLSYFVYKFMHRERCRLRIDPWHPFDAQGGAAKAAFDGDAALVWRLAAVTAAERWRELGLEPPRQELMNGFAYLLSLGFWSVSMLPAPLAPLLMRLDAASAPLAPAFGMRALVVWRRG